MTGNKHLGRSSSPLSFAVVGAGSAGMAAALELAKLGHSVSLFEAHSIPGGCASWYRRSTDNGPFQFDVGATVLNGLEEGQALRRFLDRHDVDLKSFEKMSQIFYQIGDRQLSFDTLNSARWLDSLKENFPNDLDFIDEVFPKLEKTARALYGALKTPVHWPMQNLSDAFWNLRLLPSVLAALPSTIGTGSLIFGDILSRYSLSTEMRSFLEMTFLISAQCGPEEVPTPWAALALFFYPLGAGTTASGMRGFHEALFRRLKEHKNVELHLMTEVIQIERLKGELLTSSSVNSEKSHAWRIRTLALKKKARTDRCFDGVISTIPRFNTEELLAQQVLGSSNLSWNEQEASLWGAYTAYLGIQDDSKWPDRAFNLHSKLDIHGDSDDGGEIYFSFSRRADDTRAPEGMRCATASTHCRLQHDGSYDKENFKLKLLEHLTNWGLAEDSILHLELGDPKTFEHFTSRKAGNVGGLPMTWENTIAHPAPQRTSLPGLYQIGDTSFPGQSVYACVMGARSVVEKISKEI